MYYQTAVGVSPGDSATTKAAYIFYKQSILSTRTAALPINTVVRYNPLRACRDETGQVEHSEPNPIVAAPEGEVSYTSSAKSFGEILTGSAGAPAGQNRLIIDPVQRPYSWGPAQGQKVAKDFLQIYRYVVLTSRSIVCCHPVCRRLVQVKSSPCRHVPLHIGTQLAYDYKRLQLLLACKLHSAAWQNMTIDGNVQHLPWAA